VNRLLGKPEFTCVLEQLDRRWYVTKARESWWYQTAAGTKCDALLSCRRTGDAHCHGGLADDHEE